MGKATGVYFQIIDAFPESDGAKTYGKMEYDAEGKPVITISMESKNIVSTAFHELTHWMKDVAPAEWERYSDYVMKWMEEKNQTTTEALIQEYMERYGLDGFETGRAKAIEEIVCDASEAMLDDKNAVFDFADRNRGIAQKIVDFFTDLFETIRNYISAHGKATDIGRALSQQETLVRDMRDMWVQAFDAAVENNKTEATKNADQTAGEVRYSKDADYSQQVDKVLANTYDKNNHVYMGNTPVRLRNILGLRNLPMLITSNHVYSMAVSKEQTRREGRYRNGVNYHNLGADILKRLPDAIDKPVFIIKSIANSKSTDIVVVTDLFDKSGNRIIAAIKPDGKGFYMNVELESIVTLSGYGKQNFNNFLQKAYKDNRILYAYKKYNQQKGIPEVQFPNNVLSADYSHSLAQYKQTVNTQYMQDSEKNNTETSSASENLRRSISDVGKVDLSTLQKENDRLRQANAHLKEQFKLTQGKKPDRNAVKKLCRKILRE